MRGGIVLVENGLNDGTLVARLAWWRQSVAFRPKIVHMEAEDVLVFDGMGDGVAVQLALKDIGGGTERSLVVLDLHAGGIFLKNRCAGKAEELGTGKELFDGLVVVTELGTMTLVENKDEPLIAQRFEVLREGLAALFRPLPVALTVLVQSVAELLDGGDDDLVGHVVGEHAADKGGGVGVFLHATLLEAIELLARRAVEILAVHDEKALVDGGVVLEEGGGLEGSEGLAAACGVPDIAVAAVLLDAIDNGLDGVDLVRPHHEQLLLVLDEHHVAADHAPELALLEEAVSEVGKVGDRLVVAVREAIDRKELLAGIEGEMPGVVVGEIEGIGAVADYKELDKAEERPAVAVAGVILVLNNLLHGAAGADAEGFQLDLSHGNAVDQEDDIIAVVAVVGIDAELVNDLEVVFAPVADIDERVGKRGAVVASKVVFLAEDPAGSKYVGGNQLTQKTLKLGIRKVDAIEGLEFPAKVELKGGTITDIGAIGVLEVAQFLDELILEILLPENKRLWNWVRVCGVRGSFNGAAHNGHLQNRYEIPTEMTG